MSILVKCPAGREGKIVIPDGVVEIAPGAFSNSCIQEVVFPDSLRKLGMSAFSFCKRLERVVLGAGLKRLEIMTTTTVFVDVLKLLLLTFLNRLRLFRHLHSKNVSSLKHLSCMKALNV